MILLKMVHLAFASRSFEKYLYLGIGMIVCYSAHRVVKAFFIQ